MGIPEAVELLKSGGPLGVAAICMAVAVYMYKGRETDRKTFTDAATKAADAAKDQLEAFRQASKGEHEKNNDKLFSLAERMASVIATTDSNQAQLAELVKELLREISEMRR